MILQLLYHFKTILMEYRWLEVVLHEGFYNFKHQHCPHLVIFIIEYFDLIWLDKCNEWPLFYNIAILQLKKF